MELSKHLVAAGPLAGLWVRTARALENAGYESREQVRADLHAGKLRPYVSVRDFGLKAYREVLVWSGLEERELRYHQENLAALPPLSQRFLEFLRPEYPEGTPLPVWDGALSLHIMGWNLAVLAPESPAAKRIEDGIRRFPAATRLLAERMLADLVRRKRRMFPDDPRVIASCVPVTEAGETRLRVEWTDAPV